MKPAIHTLTPDQAAEELALLLDEKFLVEDDLIKYHHWREANAQRVTDLEMWLMLHPVTHNIAAADEIPAQGPELVNSDDAPPQQLQSEMESAVPAPPISSTPQQRLDHQVQAYLGCLAKLKLDPTVQRIRNQASQARSRIRDLAKKFKLASPELAPVPPLPEKAKPETPKACTTACPEEALTVAPLPEPCADDCVHPDHHHDQEALAPYAPPTTQDLRELLGQVDPSASFEEVLEQLDQVAPPKAVAGAIELVDGQPDPRRIRTALRSLRRDLLGLVLDLEALDHRSRRLIDEDFQSLLHLALAAEIVIGEPDLTKAG